MNDLKMIPWNKLSPSELNPRKTVKEDGLKELAASILDKGVLQNLTARPKGKKFELVMGERRYRAVGLLVGEGKLEKTCELPVRVVTVSDLELIEMATAENVDREDMHPLDEADAYAKMVELGMTPEDIALKMGRSLGTVQKRLALSERLCDEARELLAEGEISLSQAQALIIGDKATQKALLARRGSYYGGMDADDIRDFYRRGTVKVADALFDREKYAGAYSSPDLFSDENEFEPVFLDGEQAKRLQLEAIEERAARLRQTWKFVEVLDYWKYNRYAWQTHAKTDPSSQGVLIVFDPYSLAIKEQIEGVTKREESSSNHAERPARPEDAYTAKHLEHTKVLKCQALQHHITEGPLRKALELAVYGLLGGEGVRIRTERLREVETPAVKAVFDKHREALKPFQQEYLQDDDVYGLGISAWKDEDGGVYRWLKTLSEDDLAKLFQALVASCTGPHTVNASLDDGHTWPAIAEDLGLDMREHFQLDADYLKMYKKARLIEVAAEVGITVPVESMTRAELAKFILKHDSAKTYLPPEVDFFDKKHLPEALQLKVEDKAA